MSATGGKAFLATFTDDYYACKGTGGHCDNLRKKVADGSLDPYTATIHALCAEDAYCIQTFYSNGGNVETALTILGFLPGLGEPADVVAGLIAASRGDWKGALLSFGATIPIAGAFAATKRLDGLADAAERGCVRSFSADTQVLMADGTTRPIKDLKPGDMVLATDPETGEQGPREVTHVWVHQDQLLESKLANGDTVTTTEDHPFWNDTDQQWQHAQELDQGDLLHTGTGTTAAVAGINWNTVRIGAAFNLTVEDIHTYYVLAGNVPVLVHNAPANCGGSNLIGAAADARFGAVLARQFPTSQIHPQLEIYTPYGRRFVDYAVEDGNGGYLLFEVKANGSRYTKGQRQKDTWIKNNLGWNTTVIRMDQGCPLGC